MILLAFMQFRAIAVYASHFLPEVLAAEEPCLFVRSLTRPATGGGRRQALHAAHCPSSVGQGASLNPLDFGVLLSHRIPSRDFPYQAINICNKLLARLSDLIGEVITHYDFSLKNHRYSRLIFSEKSVRGPAGLTALSGATRKAGC